MGRRTIIVKLLLCIALAAGSAAAVALTPEQVQAWTEDIGFYLREGEQHHIDFYHQTPKAELLAAADSLIQRLPDLNEYQVTIELLRIARMIGDGHSAIYIWNRDFPRLPFSLLDYRLDYFSDYYILSTMQDYEFLLGHKLLAVNGMKVEAIAEQVAPITQYVENRYSNAVRTKNFMIPAEILLGLDIVETLDEVSISVQTADGKVESHTVKLVSNNDYRDADKVHVNSPEITAFGEPELVLNDGLWLGTDTATKTAYIYFGWYPSFNDMNKFAQQAKALIQKHQLENLIIDLRDNGGGDFFISLLLASGLLGPDSIDWQNGVYTLIANNVFSASMSNSAHYRQILNATLVGSPTGANPIGYQETHNFVLPNSGLSGTFSKRFYRFQDQQSDGIQPDVEVVNTWADFAAGRDRVLEWVVDDIKMRQ